MASHENFNIFFVVPYPLDSVPGQRFRFEQYLPMFREQGIKYEVHSFLTPATNKILYKKGFYGRKIGGVLMGIIRRTILLGSIRSATVVFIFREAAPLGPPLFEWIITNLFRKKVIYDFDDSIWLTDKKSENFFQRFLKWRSKVGFICKKSCLVCCGNEYLATFSRTYNRNVKVVPTIIDTNWYQPGYLSQPDTIIIGWSGSVTTVEHFKFAIPMLTELRKKYGNRISFKIIGDGDYFNESLNIKGIPWSRQTELQDLAEITIGIMPLPDDPWTRGKCGLKGLQYMALGIPTVMSPVGVNKEIIQDGENGFIADSPDEWIEKISRLIDDANLRGHLGSRGRKTVEERFSIISQQDDYRSMFSSL